MMEWFTAVFDTTQYPARWHCGHWSAFWGWLHIYSDLFIFAAYMGIPLVILYFNKRLKWLKLSSIPVLFAAFIAFCGLTHLNEAIIFWHPYYNFAGLIKFATAVVSISTLCVIYLKLPSLIQLLTEKRTSNTLNKIIDSCPQGILIVNSQGIIVFANKLIKPLFGYEPSEIHGHNLEKMMPATFRERHENLRKLYLKSPVDRQMGVGRDLFALKKNGQNFPVEIALKPIRFEGENCVLCSIVDITERKNKEIELNKLNTSLEQSNAELEEFTYIASHDLKEPLRGIHNYSIMLMESIHEHLDDENRQRLAKLPELTKRLEEQIDALLEYSRLGKSALSFERIDLNSLIQEADDMLELFKGQKKVAVLIQPELPFVYGNYIKLIEIFTNLIANGIKYNEQEEIKIEIGVLKTPAAQNNMCTLYVKDNGIGVEPEHIDKIFTIFKRLHPRNSYGGGSGVGLTIVKKIVELHGGEIWLESNKNEGTSFYITLPLYCATSHSESKVC